MTRLAVPMRKAAGMLLEANFTFNEVQSQLYEFNQPTEGYVYLEDVVNVIGRG